MNRTSGFSIATTTMPTVKAGFTSARDLGDLQAMQREAERIRTLATAQDAETGKAAYNDSNKAEAKSARVKAVKPLAKGQGAITSFFKRSNSAISGETETPSSSTVPSLQRSQSSFPTHAPLHDISNVQPSASRAPRPFQPLSIPSHKVTNRPILVKPKRAEPEPGTENARYVLLSSSPPRPDAEDLHQAGKESRDPGSPTKQTLSSFAPASGFRPASTFHTTSMNQVQNQSAQRKTLGARRSMQPWSVKHNAMPKPRPS
jgi:DNA helicase-2/ATP-dependent DNA helicase PcrA